MYYGYMSERPDGCTLDEIYIVTPPYKTKEEASRALEARKHILYRGEYRMLCIDKFYGNQCGAVNLEETKNLIPDGCLGVRINIKK